MVDGIVEYLEKINIVFGPNKLLKLEGSKIFTKKLCEKQKIPTAKFGIFHNKKDSEKFFCNCIYQSWLRRWSCSRKGVYICEDKNQATIAVNEIFDGKFGKAHEVS